MQAYKENQMQAYKTCHCKTDGFYPCLDPDIARAFRQSYPKTDGVVIPLKMKEGLKFIK